MPDRDKSTRHAISRARWAVIQTGLVTSGLVLFGIYVLTTRTESIYFMDWYVRRVALGPMIVGALCASGYLVGSVWSGLRIRGLLYVTVILLQLIAFGTAHYAQYVNRGWRWRATNELVDFPTYMRYTTLSLASEGYSPVHTQRTAYLLRGVECLEFSLLALLSPLMLVAVPRCGLCDGTTRSRKFGAVAGNTSLAHLKHLATLGPPANSRELLLALRPNDPPPPEHLAITLTRCSVCGQGALHPAESSPTSIALPPALAAKLWAAAD